MTAKEARSLTDGNLMTRVFAEIKSRAEGGCANLNLKNKFGDANAVSIRDHLISKGYNVYLAYDEYMECYSAIMISW
jgi:hypothetical protein